MKAAEHAGAATLRRDAQQLANTMRNAWATFAADGNSSSNAVPWPSCNTAAQVLLPASPCTW
jgi:carboxylesterase type B